MGLAQRNTPRGNEVAREAPVELSSARIETYRIELPSGQDAGDLVRAGGDPRAMVRREPPRVKVPHERPDGVERAPEDQPPIDAPTAGPDFEIDGDRITLRRDGRTYRVLGLEKNTSPMQLKVNILATRDELVHQDTLDLAKARSRAALIKATASELYVEEQTMKKDIGQLLLRLESLRQQQIDAATRPKDTTPKLWRKRRLPPFWRFG